MAWPAAEPDDRERRDDVQLGIRHRQRVALETGFSVIPGSSVRDSDYDVGPRYTRMVSWQHRIAMFVLTVLTALPVSGIVVCAMLCESAATTTSHHGSGKNCEEPPRSSTDAQLKGLSEHDCSTHDAALRQATTTAAERADLSAASAPLLITVLHSPARPLPVSESVFDDNAPPGIAPPTTTPLVLRV